MKARLTAIMRVRVVRLLVAALAGTAAGFVVYQLTRLSGLPLFLLTGAIAGTAAAAVLQAYRRTARLTEVKLTIPQVSVLTFAVNDDARQVAWKLFVETATRVSTQSLGQEEGLIREALSSLYSLFVTTRDLLKEARPSVAVPGRKTVEHLAIAMLNRELRPFLAKWHPRLREFESAHPDRPESEWPENAACRAELRRVQRDIHSYALNFARLAGVTEPELVLMMPAADGAAGRPAPEPPAPDGSSLATAGPPQPAEP